MANNLNGRAGLANTVFASAARTATPDTMEYEVPGGASALVLAVDVTAVTATPAVTFLLEGVDRVSGHTWPLLASAALATTNAANAMRTYQVGPGLPATANVSANAALPAVVRVSATHGDADSITYNAVLHVL